MSAHGSLVNADVLTFGDVVKIIERDFRIIYPEVEGMSVIYNIENDKGAVFSPPPGEPPSFRVIFPT